MNKKTKTILIITIVALLLVFGGITYAYFTANIAGSESSSTIVITGGVLNIRYDNLSNTITVENIYPRDAAWVVKNFTVTGTNTTDLKMNYKVGLNVVSNTFSANELSATLENSNTAAEKEALDGTPIANTTKDVPASNTVWFGSGQFETTDPTEVHKYTLSIYYPETNTNQNANQQKAFTGKVVIEEDGTGDLAQPYIYTTNLEDSNNPVLLGQTLPANLNPAPFNTPEEAMQAFNHPFYLKHKIENGIVSESYVEFVISDELKTSLISANCDSEGDADVYADCQAKYNALVKGTYKLRGLVTHDANYNCKSQYDDGNGNCISPYYSENVSAIRTAFGMLANDENICSFGSSYDYCSVDGLNASASANGYVSADDGSAYCYVDSDGGSYCEV